MSPQEEVHSGSSRKAAVQEPVPTLEDSRVIGAVQEYLAEMEAGRRPERPSFLARYPEIAAVLEECLDGLEFVRAAAPRLQGPDHG